MAQLLICTNSPGELDTWVTPIVRTFHAEYPNGSVCIFITPCQYASGSETRLATAIPHVTQVYSPKETLRYLLARPWRYPTRSNTRVLSLGGDPLYARLLAWKHRCPAGIYTHRNIQSLAGFAHCFSSPHDDGLMAESVSGPIPDPPIPVPANYLLVLCGSRPQHFFNLLPFMLSVIQELKRTIPTIPVVLGVSPFIDPNDWKQCQATHDCSGIHCIHTPSMTPYIANAKLIVSIPGTNNAQMAYLKKPALVLLPTNKPRALILDGLAGLIGKLPILGTAIVRLAIAHTLKTTPFFSLPNRWLGHAIYPEYVGHLHVNQVANATATLWNTCSQHTHIQSSLSKLTKKYTSETILRLLFEGESS
tara:strand:- start:13339 stop:14427 length:1089 start_codon:yes stop_codon:yes gene_type:complete